MIGLRDVAMRERAGLLDAAEEFGPDAPTLCGSWTVHDLLAHLWVREHEPAALAGLVIPRLHHITERHEQVARQNMPFDEVLGALRNGIPLPFGLPVAREVGNVHEFFVHHEDIRRANGRGPRPVDGELASALWWRLRVMGVSLFRRAHGLDVHLRRPDGTDAAMKPFARGVKVTVVGEVPELFLYAFNRKAQAVVTFDGDADAVARLQATTLGL